jgi:hypothetical protein
MVLLISAIALAESASSLDLNPIVILGIIGLLAGIAFSVEARLERLRVPIAMVPFGILATLSSDNYSVASNPRQFGECSVVHFSRGFPLPWDGTNYISGNLSGGFPCVLTPPIFYIGGSVSFFLDLIFYVAVGVAIIQLYRGIRGTTVTAGSSRVKNIIQRVAYNQTI